MKYDLHIHSCLSPCADADMTPSNITGMVHLENLDVLAVLDHNSARNLPAVLEHCKNFGIKFLPGIEISSSEDIHIVSYFKTLEEALLISDIIYENLPKIKNRTDIYNPQLILNSDDEVIKTEENLLSISSNLSVYEVVNLVHKHNGICFYAHVDKLANSVLSILGDVPEDIDIDGYEIYDMGGFLDVITQYPKLQRLPYISNSDAHTLHLVGEDAHTLDENHILYKFILDIQKNF